MTPEEKARDDWYEKMMGLLQGALHNLRERDKRTAVLLRALADAVEGAADRTDLMSPSDAELVMLARETAEWMADE